MSGEPNISGTMVRVFFAVEPAEEIREAVAAAGSLFRTSSARLGLVDISLMHITLKFLGEVPESRVPELSAVLQNLRCAPYELTVRHVDVFGRPPRVIKAGISDGGVSAVLARRIDALTAPLGFPRDSKPFSPHITIARVREYAPDLHPILAELRSREFGTCLIDTVLLKKSTLTSRGPIYETLSEVRL